MDPAATTAAVEAKVAAMKASIDAFIRR